MAATRTAVPRWNRKLSASVYAVSGGYSSDPRRGASTAAAHTIHGVTTKGQEGQTHYSKDNSVLEWTAGMVEDLMRLHYDTFSARFGNARNNAAIGEAWLLLASEVSRLHDKAISTEQCKNKVKWLKRKWAEYNSDMRATGNAETPVTEPPALGLMMEYWASSSGMNGQTLADSEADTETLSHDAEADNDEETATADRSTCQTTRSKKRKTMADSFEVGMKSMADSFKAMAAAMATPAPTITSGDISGMIDQRFAVMMQRQEAQLSQVQMQTHYLAELITKLGTNNEKQ